MDWNGLSREVLEVLKKQPDVSLNAVAQLTGNLVKGKFNDLGGLFQF